MTYTKPVVSELGDASQVIQVGNKSNPPGETITSGPAYDLDE